MAQKSVMLNVLYSISEYKTKGHVQIILENHFFKLNVLLC